MLFDFPSVNLERSSLRCAHNLTSWKQSSQPFSGGVRRILYSTMRAAQTLKREREELWTPKVCTFMFILLISEYRLPRHPHIVWWGSCVKSLVSFWAVKIIMMQTLYNKIGSPATILETKLNDLVRESVMETKSINMTYIIILCSANLQV